MIDIPNKKNFCGGAFPDWLEVNLTDKCNGSCAWCVDRGTWHPKYHAPWKTICNAAIESRKRNIILLGGEPTLHPDFSKIVVYLTVANRRVWVTTNGSQLSAEWALRNSYLFGINISVHHYDLIKNREITGISLDAETLKSSIEILKNTDQTNVRFNCNCIKGFIDSAEEIRKYVRWAMAVGAEKVRFAELKNAEDDFVDLAKILNYKYGLNDNPFKDGCNSDAVVDGMLVNFRQMCGMQTRLRPCPENPQGVAKKVLYYDGIMYDGWQTEEPKMTEKEIENILDMVLKGEISKTAAKKLLSEGKEKVTEKIVTVHHSGGYCQY